MNKLTSKGKNFGAHAATHENITSNLEIALDNLAMAATSDKMTIDKLTDTNKGLVNQLEQALITIQKLMDDNQQLLRIVEKGLPSSSNAMMTKQKSWEDNAAYDPDGYCWTHRYKGKKRHNSATCVSPRPEHKREATRRNTMGGSMANKDWKPK